jgi:hypothetical protein
VAVETCYDFQNASKDKARAIRQLSRLEELLDGIFRAMEDPPVPLPIMKPLLREELPSCLEDLRQLKKKLETPGGRTARLLASFSWTLREGVEVKKTLGSLRDFQSMLSIAMVAENLCVSPPSFKPSLTAWQYYDDDAYQSPGEGGPGYV